MAHILPKTAVVPRSTFRRFLFATKTPRLCHARPVRTLISTSFKNMLAMLASVLDFSGELCIPPFEHIVSPISQDKSFFVSPNGVCVSLWRKWRMTALPKISTVFMGRLVGSEQRSRARNI